MDLNSDGSLDDWSGVATNGVPENENPNTVGYQWETWSLFV